MYPAIGCEQFLEHAARHGPGSINLYLGHGDRGVDFDLEKYLRANFPNASPPPLYGMGCCFTTSYNGYIPDANRIKPTPTNKDAIHSGTMPHYIKEMVEAMDKLIRERLKKGDPVNVNLYFGEFDSRLLNLTGEYDPITSAYDQWNWPIHLLHDRNRSSTREGAMQRCFLCLMSLAITLAMTPESLRRAQGNH